MLGLIVYRKLYHRCIASKSDMVMPVGYSTTVVILTLLFSGTEFFTFMYTRAVFDLMLMWRISLVVSVLSKDEYIQIPLRFVTDQIQEPLRKEKQYWNATLCGGTQVYHGLTVVVQFNLPYNPEWLVHRGVVYATVSKSDTFSRDSVLCVNHDFDHDNLTRAGRTVSSSCSFRYTTDIGSSIYIAIEAGDTPGIVYSVGISFINDEEQLPPVIRMKLPPKEARELMSQTNSEFKRLKPILKMERPRLVKTLDSAYYTFTLCESPATEFVINILVFGVKTSDAVATYVCNSSLCDPDSNNVVKSDPSGTFINTISVPYARFPDGTIYICVIGWGGNVTNNFHIGATIQSKEQESVSCSGSK